MYYYIDMDIGNRRKKNLFKMKTNFFQAELKRFTSAAISKCVDSKHYP